jgi:hypothetical protein
MRARLARCVRACKLIVRDGRIPRPLRWLAGVAALPIPGPIDEIVLLLIAPVLWTFYRGPMREAWAEAAVQLPSPR